VQIFFGLRAQGENEVGGKSRRANREKRLAAEQVLQLFKLSRRSIGLQGYHYFNNSFWGLREQGVKE
jgi:hypothetical protein